MRLTEVEYPLSKIFEIVDFGFYIYIYGGRGFDLGG
jgi:hypothetical protein